MSVLYFVVNWIILEDLDILWYNPHEGRGRRLDMPYVFKEVLDDEEIEADVVERADYDSVIQERDQLMTQRDEAISRAEIAEKGWEESRNKYADAFLTSPARVKKEQEENVRADGVVRSFQELFDTKEGY